MDTRLPWTEWKPTPGDTGWQATCDWGDCDEPTVTVRWEDHLKQWLPVCASHAPDRDARCAALPPDHKAWECE